MRTGATASDPSRDDGVGVPTRDRVLGLLRLVFGAVLFGFVVVAAWRSWDAVQAAITLIDPYDLLFAEALILLGLALSVLTWRQSVSEVGYRVPVAAAARIYLLGQLGKYLPGSLWALAAQSELGRSAGVPRSRGLAASIIAIAVNTATGLAIGVAIVPSLADGSYGLTLGLVAIVLCLAFALTPPVLTRLVNLGLRLVRRPSLPRNVTWRGVRIATAWSLSSAVSYGLSVWVLAVAVGAPAGEALPLCLAGVSLGMTIGLLVVVTPSGIGVREAIIVGALAPVLDRSDALAVALVARLLFTIADLVAAAVVVPIRVRPPAAA